MVTIDYNKINLTKPEIWNRKIINSLWIICLIYVIGQLLVLILRVHFYPSESPNGYIHKHVITPNILLSAIMLLTELNYKLIKKFHEELIVLSSILVANAILLTISPKISGGQMVLLLPIAVSIFYFRKKIMILTLSADLSIFTLLYILSPYQREYISIFAYVLIVLMLLGTAKAGISIIERGTELMKSVEELAKSEEKLIIEKTMIDKLSKTDALTGLYNHITFHEYLDSVIKQCDTNDLPLQLALIDIDDFKKVNDTFGHRTGDIVLKQVAQKVLEYLTPNDFIARYGGEEFAIIFTGKPLQESYCIIEQARGALENSTYAELNGKSVTISVGIHDYIKGQGKETLFHSTDIALYSAKKAGKNQTVCSTDTKQN